MKHHKRLPGKLHETQLHQKLNENKDYYIKAGLAGIVVLAAVGLLYISFGRDIVGQATGARELCDSSGDGQFFLGDSGELERCNCVGDSCARGSCEGDACAVGKVITVNPGSGKVIVTAEGALAEEVLGGERALSVGPLPVGTELTIETPDYFAPGVSTTKNVFAGWSEGTLPDENGKVIVTGDERFVADWGRWHFVDVVSEVVGGVQLTDATGQAASPGTVTLEPESGDVISGGAFYEEGSTITAVAEVADPPTQTSRYRFDNWRLKSRAGELTPINLLSPTVYPFTEDNIFNKPYGIRAVFMPQFQVAASAGGDGYGDVVASGLPTGNSFACDGATCSGFYDKGTGVHLTATSESGNVFDGWGGVCEAVGTPKIPRTIFVPASSAAADSSTIDSSTFFIGRLLTDLAWSSGGPISGKSCLQITEPSEPTGTTWADNYLCTPEPLGYYGLGWSSAGSSATAGNNVQIYEGADPHTWADNYLFSVYNLGLRWTHDATTVASYKVNGMRCVGWVEINDPPFWPENGDNFLCYPDPGDNQGQSQWFGKSDDGSGLSAGAAIGQANYDISVPVAGTYTLSLGAASQNPAAASCRKCAEIFVGGISRGRFDVPDTGGAYAENRGTYREAVISAPITFAQSGNHRISVKMYNDETQQLSFRLAWLKLTPTTPPSSVGTCDLVSLDAAKTATASFQQEFVTDVFIASGVSCSSGTLRGTFANHFGDSSSLCVKKSTTGSFVTAIEKHTTQAQGCDSSSYTPRGLLSSLANNLCIQTGAQPKYTDVMLDSACRDSISVATFLAGDGTQYSVCAKTPTYQLTVNKAGTGLGTVTSNVGGIDCGTECSKRVPAGAIRLTATPDPGSIFDVWDGACSGSSSTCDVTMNGRKVADAHFKALNGLVVCSIPITNVEYVGPGPDGTLGTADDEIRGARTALTQPIGNTLPAKEACAEAQVFGTVQTGAQPDRVDVTVEEVNTGEVISDPSRAVEFLRCTLDCASLNYQLTTSIATCKALTELPDAMAPVSGDAATDPANEYYIITPEQVCGVA